MLGNEGNSVRVGSGKDGRLRITLATREGVGRGIKKHDFLGPIGQPCGGGRVVSE